MKNIGKIFLASALGGALTLGSYKIFLEPDYSSTTIIESAQPDNHFVKTSYKVMEESSFTEAADKSLHAVVHVQTAVKYQAQPQSPLDFFFGAPQQRGGIAMGSGSGVIISKDGYIVTNNHVIENAENMKVSLNNGKSYEASLVGTDPTTDIALIKIDAEEEELDYLTFSNSDQTRVGEWVLAVGNPFNLTSTVTAGIVSAKSRNLGIIGDRAAIESFIQTDAAVNPGNSGGALVNANGDLIGINTAIASQNGTYEGYSFAVPSNIVKKVVEDLLEFGTVQRAFIGVNISDITPRLATELDIKRSNGVYVGGVTENGAAEQAGIKTGDIITAVNSKLVNKSSELQEAIGRKRPGDNVVITVDRAGEKMDFEVRLRNLNGTTKLFKKEDIQFMTLLGGSFEPLTKNEKARLGITYGVRVTDVKRGILAEQNVPSNFIITRINRHEIREIEDINNAVDGLKQGEPVVVEGYLPNGRYRYFAFDF